MRSPLISSVVAEYIMIDRERHPSLGKVKLLEGLKPLCAKANIGTVQEKFVDYHFDGRAYSPTTSITD